MSDYICSNSFTAQNGKRYSHGERANSYDYGNLKSSEQSNFGQEEDRPSGRSMAEDILRGDIFGTGIPGGYDMDMSTLI